MKMTIFKKNRKMDDEILLLFLDFLLHESIQHKKLYSNFYILFCSLCKRSLAAAVCVQDGGTSHINQKTGCREIYRKDKLDV